MTQAEQYILSFFTVHPPGIYTTAELTAHVDRLRRTGSETPALNVAEVLRALERDGKVKETPDGWMAVREKQASQKAMF